MIGWIAFSACYWFLALAFAMGAMLGGCEPPASGCTEITPGMLLWSAMGLYALIILAAILARKRPRA